MLIYLTKGPLEVNRNRMNIGPNRFTGNFVSIYQWREGLIVFDRMNAGRDGDFANA